MTDNNLEMSGVTVEFSGLKALDKISLSLKSGEILGLIGPNGSGKTTTINAITGQVPMTSGEILLCGKKISGLSPRKIALKGIARSFQIVRLFDNLTAFENIEVSALSQGKSRKEARSIAQSMLESFSLEKQANELCNSLSYGDKRRVEIARALASNPLFLFLDEPAAGMNDVESEVLLNILKEIPKKYNLGLLIIDHDMSLILRLCDRLQVIASGKTIAEGNSEAVTSNPAVIEAYLGSSSS